MATLTSSKLHIVLVGCFKMWSAATGTKCNSMQFILYLLNSLVCITYERIIFFFCCCVNKTCHLCVPLLSHADSQNGLLSVLPTALKWSLQWSQPGDSEWKGYCMWPYMSSWGGPIAICTQKWYKVLRLNLEEEFRVLHSVCSVGSERTIFSKGLGRSCAVLAKWCLSHAVGYKALLYTWLRSPPRQMKHGWRWGLCVSNKRKPCRGPLWA